MSSDFHSKYEAKDKIGEGTFSDVLKCQCLSTGQTLAVKKLKKQYKNISEALHLPEVIVLQNLSPHPNVLSLVEYIFDQTKGNFFMIFELMEMNLYDLIQSRKRCLPESRVKQIFYQILKGVQHLHSHGIFHRDIKPENILIKKSVVKLADLGSVRGIYSQAPYTEYISTRWYRAPECILTAGNYGPKMDVWACGCVYYEMLTSKPIFPGSNELDQLTKIHQVVGSPNSRIITKIKRNKCRLGDIRFPLYSSINLAVILPFTSDSGRELLKRMLVYDPEIRTNVRRLLEHRYFNDLRETAPVKSSNNSINTKQWNIPLILVDKNNVTTFARKNKLKTKETVIHDKKKAGTNLITNSWAPSSNTSKVILTQSKSKPNQKISPPGLKKGPGLPPVKPGLKKNSTVKSFPRPLIKQENMKANSTGNLPRISQKPEKIQVTKSQVVGFRFKAPTHFLPPIKEQ